MLFNSLQFVIFFVVVAVVYFAVPHRFRWLLLLVASYYFYMSWNPAYSLLLVFSTAAAYFSAMLMARAEDKSHKRLWFILSLIASLGLLFTFKYYNFFNEHFLGVVCGLSGGCTFLPKSELLLPVGISFYTFQTLSYTIDIYRGTREPERHFGIFALYVSFFPQLVAGPIERSTRLLPQFYERKKFDYNRVTDGLKYMIWGYFLKMVIADRLGSFVDAVYNSPDGWQGISIAIATVFFGYQVYCDFAGYSYIAIGAAKILGFDLMQNFRRPYLAKSFSDFWGRWHISLSTWLRDYLFLPVAYSSSRKIGEKKPLGIKSESWSYIIAAGTTMFLAGLWHGAAWTFIIWGVLHGTFLIMEGLTKNPRKVLMSKIGFKRKSCLNTVISTVITFSAVQFAWIFFRSNSIHDAIYFTRNLFRGWGDLGRKLSIEGGFQNIILLGKNDHEFFVAVSGILFLHIVNIIEEHHGELAPLRSKNLFVRWGFYYIIVFGILLFRYFTYKFIYFQF